MKSVPKRRDALVEAIDNLYDEHLQDVARWVRRLAGPRQDVEDLIHDVFAVAVRRRAEFRGDASVKTWLFRITNKVVLGRRRSERVRRWLFARHAEELTGERGAAVTPLEEMERREQIALVYEALDRVPDSCRTPLILYEIEGLSGERIAELLGIHVGAVWVRLHRGRARLQGELIKQEKRR